MKILVVEDDIDLNEAISEGLRLNSYAVDSIYNGREAYDLLLVESYDLVILDLNLPEMDGLEVLRRINQENSRQKFIILSARTQVSDKVAGLDLGASDYLDKPFHFDELEARIRNLTRREFVQGNSTVSYANITLDTTSRAASINGTQLNLTRKEFAILEYFMINQERIISQEEFIDHVWDQSVDSFSASIRVHISSLRKKIEQHNTVNPIQTKIGEGYIFTCKVSD